MTTESTTQTPRVSGRLLALGACVGAVSVGMVVVSPAGGLLVRLAHSQNVAEVDAGVPVARFTPESVHAEYARAVRDNAELAAGMHCALDGAAAGIDQARGLCETIHTWCAARPVAMIRTASFDEPGDIRTRTTQSRTTTIVENDGKRTIKLEITNGEVKAFIDGNPVPAERVQRLGETVIINDDAGTEIYRYGGDSGRGVLGGPTPPPVPPIPPDVRAWTINRFGGEPGQARVWTNQDAEPAPKSMIGVQLIEPDATLRGHFGLKRGEATLVAAVYDGLPAALAGLEPYDLIVGVDGAATASVEDVRKALRQKEPGSSVQITVIKKGERRTLTLTPEAFDREKLSRAKVERMAAADMNSPFAVAFSGPGEDGSDAWTAMGEPMNSAFADSFKDFGREFAQAWSTPEARQKWLEEFRESWSKSAPQGWGGPGDPLVAVITEPDGRPRAEVFMRLRAEQQELAERMRRMADEMRAAVQQRADAAQQAQRAHSDAIDASRELEQQIERLQQMLKEMRERSAQPAPADPNAAPTPAPAPAPAPGSSMRPLESRHMS